MHISERRTLDQMQLRNKWRSFIFKTTLFINSLNTNLKSFALSAFCSYFQWRYSYSMEKTTFCTLFWNNARSMMIPKYCNKLWLGKINMGAGSLLRDESNIWNTNKFCRPVQIISLQMPRSIWPKLWEYEMLARSWR